VTALAAFCLKTDSGITLLTKFLQFLEKFVAVHYSFYRSFLSEHQGKNVRNRKYIGNTGCIVNNCNLSEKRIGERLTFMGDRIRPAEAPSCRLKVPDPPILWRTENPIGYRSTSSGPELVKGAHRL
jgi:hypothetical protein